jgi:purine-cytosine permease-like protein
MDSTYFTPPQRRSMTDQAIQEALGNAKADEAGISAAMELLETQAQLRDIEKMEFSAWVLEMEQNGSPEARLAVENAHRAQKGLEPLTSLAPEPVPLPPIDDVVSHLNNLYANQAPAQPAEPEFSEPLVSEPEFSDPLITESTFSEAALVEEQIEIPVEFSIDLPAINESLDDEFDRLLAADTVVGAEDELTALEEELEHAAVPVEAIENLTVVEDDPGIVFAPVGASAIEEVKLESAPKLSRRSRSSSQFWSWLGLSGSVLPLGLAWYVSKTGVAFSQAVVAVFLGLLASALVISVGALAGKRSGLPTLMLSRAPFGVYANAAPASILTVVRIFWSGVIGVAAIILAMQFLSIESISDITKAESANHFIWLGAFLVLLIGGAITLAIFGGRVLFRAQQIVGILGTLAALLLIGFTANDFGLQSLLAQPTGDWDKAFGISVLTFSIFGLAWTSSGADFARKLSTTARGAAVVGWGFLALVIVPTIVAAYGIALISSITPLSAEANQGFQPGTLFGDFVSVVDPWLGYVLIASGVLSGIVILSMSMYSSNLGLHSIGAKLKPGLAQPVLGAIVLTLGVAGVYYLTDPWVIIADYARLIAIPVAAWAGIFISDVLIRRIAYHEISLSRGYGFYKSVNVVNIIAWAVATAVGLGFTYIEQAGVTWTGYIADQLVNQEFWATTSFGIIITFAFASLVPVLFGIPRIKKQEQEVLLIESRRDDLKDIFNLAE